MGTTKIQKIQPPTPRPYPKERGIFTNIRCPPNMLGNFSQYFLKLEVSCLQDPPEILRKVQQKLPFVLKIL
jgi:hypothetical protein